VLGGIRGVFFLDVGGAGLNGNPFTAFRFGTTSYRPVIGAIQDPITGLFTYISGPPINISGFRLEDARGSYGIGLETFALGIPFHFDWAWKTLFNKDWEDALFYLQGGSQAFRKGVFKFWIGYDF